MVHAVSPPPGRAALAVRFFALGALAFGVKTAIAGAPRAERPLVVEIARGASSAERERAVEEAMLLDLAERAELPRVDAVVREQVVRRLAVVEDVADSNAAVDRGLALGLHRSDPLARERLLSDARELLAARAAPAPPSDDEARAYLTAHEARYATPPRVRFKQLFLSRQRRGDRLASDAATLGQRLAAGEDIAEADGWAWTHATGSYSEARLDALIGAGFGAAVLAASPATWVGPIESSFGLHYVWVLERTPSLPVPVAQTLPRVRADLAAEAQERARSEQLTALRRGYRIAWVER